MFVFYHDCDSALLQHWISVFFFDKSIIYSKSMCYIYSISITVVIIIMIMKKKGKNYNMTLCNWRLLSSSVRPLRPLCFVVLMHQPKRSTFHSFTKQFKRRKVDFSLFWRSLMFFIIVLRRFYHYYYWGCGWIVPAIECSAKRCLFRLFFHRRIFVFFLWSQFLLYEYVCVCWMRNRCVIFMSSRSAFFAYSNIVTHTHTLVSMHMCRSGTIKKNIASIWNKVQSFEITISEFRIEIISKQTDKKSILSKQKSNEQEKKQQNNSYINTWENPKINMHFSWSKTKLLVRCEIENIPLLSNEQLYIMIIYVLFVIIAIYLNLCLYIHTYLHIYELDRKK